MTARANRWIVALAMLLLGCAAAPPAAPGAWFLASAEDFPGVWESVAPQVAADGAVLRTFHALRADGTFEVVVVAYARRLVVYSSRGTWRPSATGIDFVEDGEEPYTATIRGRRLRLSRGSRSLELERVLDEPLASDELLAMPPPGPRPGS